jgi:hypothetical protein
MIALRSVVFVVAFSMLIVGVQLAADPARAGDFPTVPYALLGDSTYQEGCFEPSSLVMS